MTSNDRAGAFAPASIANLACGFDVFGLALETPGDEVVVERHGPPGVRIASIEGDRGQLPRAPERNTAAVAARAMLDHLGEREVGIELHLRKGLPLGSGLGSSAASSVAAVVAVNRLLGDPLERRALLPFTIEAERAACGAAHADNVAPSLLGGLALVRSLDPLDVVEVDTPPDLWCAVVRPHLNVRTEDARRVLPADVPLEIARDQWANTAALVAGMLQSDYALIGRALVDGFAEPRRAPRVPGFEQVRSAAQQAGALGGSLSGSGPAVFSLCEGEVIARRVVEAMAAAFEAAGLASDPIVSRVNPNGAQILQGDALS